LTRIEGQEYRVIKEAYGKIPTCEHCGKTEATIWIRGLGKNNIDLFLCDPCAFHLARIIILDIGHVKEIIR